MSRSLAASQIARRFWGRSGVGFEDRHDHKVVPGAVDEGGLSLAAFFDEAVGAVAGDGPGVVGEDPQVDTVQVGGAEGVARASRGPTRVGTAAAVMPPILVAGSGQGPLFSECASARGGMRRRQSWTSS